MIKKGLLCLFIYFLLLPIGYSYGSCEAVCGNMCTNSCNKNADCINGCNNNCSNDCQVGDILLGFAAVTNESKCFKVCHKYCVMPACPYECGKYTNLTERDSCLMQCYESCSDNCGQQCLAEIDSEHTKWVFEFWAMLGFFVAFSLAVVGWYFSRKHRRETVKLMNQIEGIYRTYSKHRDDCVQELDNLKSVIKTEYSENKIEEENFNYLNQIINEDIAKIHRKETLSLMSQIDEIYNKFAKKRNVCLVELNKLKNKIKDEYSESVIVEANFHYLIERINNYISTLKKRSAIRNK